MVGKVTFTEWNMITSLFILVLSHYDPRLKLIILYDICITAQNSKDNCGQTNSGRKLVLGGIS